MQTINPGAQTVAVSELIDAHVRHLRAARKSPHTITGRVRALRALHAWLPFGLAYASTDELEEWLGHDPDWSSWTMYTYAGHVRGFYRWANGRVLAGDPAADMARPRTPHGVPRPVTDEELQIALARSREPWFTAIILAAYAGLRVAELCGVHREDVTEDTIHIRQAKGGDPAAVDTHPIVWELVQGRPRGPLCRHPRGRPLTPRWVGDNGRAHFDALGLPEVTMHRFRHWFGTALLEGGNDLRTVQESLRHRSIISTQGYTLVRGGQRRLAIRSLPTPAEHPDEH